MARERFTIVGARGFIGSALTERLIAAGHDVAGISHDDPSIATRSLDHVIYCSGIAASAASDAAYAQAVHVEGVRRIIATGNAASLLYLSTTRVYGESADTRETAALPEPPASDEYRRTKIAGEALVLNAPQPAFRAARLSNVIGPSFRSTLFVADIVRQAARGGPVAVRTTRDSAKDYLAIDDACRYLIALARGGRERLYNVAYGANVENGVLYDALRDASRVPIEIAPDAARAVTPPIAVERLHAEFGPAHVSIAGAIPGIYRAFTAHASRAFPGITRHFPDYD